MTTFVSQQVAPRHPRRLPRGPGAAVARSFAARARPVARSYRAFGASTASPPSAAEGYDATDMLMNAAADPRAGTSPARSTPGVPRPTEGPPDTVERALAASRVVPAGAGSSDPPRDATIGS